MQASVLMLVVQNCCATNPNPPPGHLGPVPCGGRGVQGVCSLVIVMNGSPVALQKNAPIFARHRVVQLLADLGTKGCYTRHRGKSKDGWRRSDPARKNSVRQRSRRGDWGIKHYRAGYPAASPRSVCGPRGAQHPSWRCLASSEAFQATLRNGVAGYTIVRLCITANAPT